MDRVEFGIHFLALIYPISCLVIFNLGIGLILSALFVFFRDMSYLYDIFTMLLMYLSAIFYTVDIMPEKYQTMFLLNPVYVYIKYFRTVVLDGQVPSFELHLLGAFYAFMAILVGAWIYKKYNYKFLYYV